jgi:membrane protease YdiL (CAAX protease family)
MLSIFSLYALTINLIKKEGHHMFVATNISPTRIWLQKHSLFAYFVLAFGISWLIELPVVLSRSGIGWLPYDLPPMLTSTSPGVPLGPVGAAFILTALLEGKPGVIRLLKRYIQWQVSLKWYLLVLLGVPLLLTLTVSLFYAPHLQNIPVFLGSYLMHLLIAFMINGEEGGWRGFALPRLQKQFGPLQGSIILGLLWGLWHVPLMLIPSQSPLNHAVTLSLLIFFFIQITAKSISYTWLSNNTGGNLLIVTLFHAALNGYQVEPLFGSMDRAYYQLALAICFGIVALLIIAFTRGTLSYKPDELEKKAGGTP